MCDKKIMKFDQENLSKDDKNEIEFPKEQDADESYLNLSSLKEQIAFSNFEEPRKTI
jgi:hypothetical protein